MTTPEKFRRRQRIEGTLLVIIGLGWASTSLYFQHQDSVQETCLRSYISTNSDTSKIRSRLVERESETTRNVIRSALTAKSREQLFAARDRYFSELARIDELRAENPVQAFKGC